MSSVHQNESDGITVSYPTRESQQTMSKGDYFAVRSIGESNKIRAIKFVRMQTGLGLYESKQIVDTILSLPDVLKDHSPPASINQTSLGALLRANLNDDADWRTA
jgi:ribosomal protein L7/L12